MSRLPLLLCAIVALCTYNASADAQTCSAAMTPITFPAVSPIRGAPVSTTATLTVTCNWTLVSLAPNALVCVNLGTGSASISQNPRTLGNGANRLQYRVAGNTAYSPLWGSTATSTTPISVTLAKPALGTSASANVTVNAQVLGNQFTVPTVNNATTAYTESFGGTATVNYGYYLLGAPTCASLAAGGTFTPTITANVINDCTISATPMNFGTQGLLDRQVDAVSTLNVQCTNSDAYRIALNGGNNGTVTNRRMLRAGGTQTVDYQLYTDSSRSIPWGDGTAGTAMVENTGTGASQSVTVYGRVRAQTSPVPGAYADTVTATIYF
ncbi:hypothetical protein CAL26_14765 [Bordetella genomosp. 9]|uniref:Spore coat protein U/FanG domain-containing protein n=1 Tax=Bordetella genomosp. 9 TaxID=1416803 RepID=A0A261R1S6_9BORD|nr:spore coat U domain-containing protein [Bordetella genomosp. 9]OZI18931.1 hypothetical protein CAL26_14765 [Bordetella genomosp. 9]